MTRLGSLSLASLLAVGHCHAAGLTSGALSFSTAGSDYQVSVDGEKWFDSGPTVFSAEGKTYSTADGSLRPAGPASNGAPQSLSFICDLVGAALPPAATATPCP